jgi:hypothetical protein
MSNLLFTGQVAIPDIKGSVRDLSTILQNNTILQQKQLELQARQTAATQRRRSEVMKSLYGEGLSGVHEAALPFVRQALDEVALQIDPLLDQEGGDLLAQRMIRNALDSVARYQDDDAWHEAEQRYIALGDTTTAEYAKVKGELGPGMRPVTTTDATLLGDIARGRGVRGMRSVVNPDGTFSIRGFDSGALEETDISQMTWWNSENLFNNSVQYAGVEVASLQEQGERWKNENKDDGPYDAAAARSHFENYVRRDGQFLFQDFLGATPDNEIFQLRLSAYARDREKLLRQFTELDDRSLLNLYQLRESDFEGRDTLRKAITKSLDDAIDEAVRYTPYPTDDDEDGDGFSLVNHIENKTQVTDRPTFDVVVTPDGVTDPFELGLIDVERGNVRTATINVSEVPDRDLPAVELETESEEYAQYLRDLETMSQAQIDLKYGASRPRRQLTGRQVRGFSRIQNQPNKIFVDVEGLAGHLVIDLMNAEDGELLSSLASGFDIDMQQLYNLLGEKLTPRQEPLPQPGSAPPPGVGVTPAEETSGIDYSDL